MLNQGRPTASFVVSCMTLLVHSVDVDSIEVPHADTPVSHDKADKEGATAIVPGEVQEPTEEDEASKGWTDHFIKNFTSVWKQDPSIQEFKADGSQRDGEATLQGSGIRGFVGQLCGERRNVRDRWATS